MVLLITNKIELKRKAALKDEGQKAVSYGNAASSLQKEKMSIRRENRNRGIIGELGVAGVLEKLAQEYGLTVLHDLSIPGKRANIDHILITSKVIYVIDAKNYSGKVTISPNRNNEVTLRVGGRDQMDLVRKVKKYAAEIETFLQLQDVRMKVIPMLAFYKGTFDGKSSSSIEGVAINLFGIENELLRYANLKSPSIDIALVAEKILGEFPPKA